MPIILMQLCLSGNTSVCVGDQEIKDALESYLHEKQALELITKGTNQIILDANNANPSAWRLQSRIFYN